MLGHMIKHTAQKKAKAISLIYYDRRHDFMIGPFQGTMHIKKALYSIDEIFF